MTDANATGNQAGSGDVSKQIEHLTTQLQNWQAKATDYEKRFAGIDPEAFKAMKEDYDLMKKEAAQKDPKKFDEWAAGKEKEIESRFSKKFTEFETELNNTRSELNRLRVVNPANLKAAEIFNSASLPLIQMLIEKDLAYDNGEIVVKGQDGKAKVSAKDPRRSMDLAEYLEGLAETYPDCAKPRGKGGSKEPGVVAPANGAGSGSGVTAEQYISMTKEQRAQIPLVERGKLAKQVLGQR